MIMVEMWIKMSEISKPSGKPSVEASVKASRTRVLIINILIVVLIISNADIFMTFND